MDAKLIFWPMFTLMLLTQLLYVPLVLRKFKAVKNKQVDLKKTALNLEDWNDDVKKVNNNLRNLFETPFIFYLLCVTQFVTEQVTVWTIGLAWLYVLSRFAHTFIHTGSNYVPLRMRVFAFSLLVLLVITVMTMLGL